MLADGSLRVHSHEQIAWRMSITITPTKYIPLKTFKSNHIYDFSHISIFHHCIRSITSLEIVLEI